MVNDRALFLFTISSLQSDNGDPQGVIEERKQEERGQGTIVLAEEADKSYKT